MHHCLKRISRLALISALLPALGGIALSTLVAPPASARHVCSEHVQMIDTLKSLYGERMISSTNQEKDRRLEFWVSRKGSWSLVLVLPTGRACLKSSGPHPFTEKLRVVENPALRSAAYASSG